MLYMHQRMAELWIAQKSRNLTPDEEVEFHHCNQANADYAYKLAKLHNESLMCSMINDYEGQHECCRRIEELEFKYAGNVKKSDAS